MRIRLLAKPRTFIAIACLAVAIGVAVWALELPPKASISITLTATIVADAVKPRDELPILIPRPKHSSLDFDHPITLTGRFRHAGDQLTQALSRRFNLAGLTGQPLNLRISTGPNGLRPCGYRIRLEKTGIRIDGQDDPGTRFGIERVASIAFARDGRICLPTGTIEDWPSSPWRGAHLFVGPKAIPFQRRLWQRVLLPLGFNKAVLECEQTDWKSTPGISGPSTMSRDDLKELFAMYRSIGVEPIPLIQSFGHMTWLFNGNKNLGLALDPKARWAVNLRNPRARTLLKNLWEEAIGLLHPTTVHFGLDEVSLRGSPGDSPLLTTLWKDQLRFLSGIATQHHVRPMIWGDQALAPGEAIDYCLASSKAEAAERRNAIPKGALIGDWHYAPDFDPGHFGASLDLWRKEGFVPVAASWYKPTNIAAFDIAATKRGAGTLQTTWSGYESSESNMESNLKQFTAMVLAAEYSWSGRIDPPNRLGYDPGTVFRELYYGRPHVTSSVPGTLFGDGSAFQIGDVRFRRLDSLNLRTDLDQTGPREIQVVLNAKGNSLTLAVQTAARCKYGEPVANVTVLLDGGLTIIRTLHYGIEVRSKDDADPCPLTERRDGVSCYSISVQPNPSMIRSISITSRNDSAGLKLVGITLT
jgi:hypothetical protein